MASGLNNIEKTHFNYLMEYKLECLSILRQRRLDSSVYVALFHANTLCRVCCRRLAVLHVD